MNTRRLSQAVTPLTSVTHLLSLLVLLMLPAELLAGQGAPPRSYSQTVLPLATVQQVVLPAVDTQALLAADAAVSRPGPLTYAVPRSVEITPQTHGTWEDLPGGDRLWRLRFSVPGATDLNFGFTRYALPIGATLHILSAVEEYYQGPYTARDTKAHGQLWTPAVPGDSAILELYLPAEASTEVMLVLTQVSAGYRDLFRRLPREKQGACNNDVNCPVGNPWRNQIRSVGRFSIGGTGLCTGTLIMDVSRSFRPFFLTANHCDVTPGNASTVVVYWNFESPTCGALDGGSLADNQTSATFRAARADVDVALLELDDRPAVASRVFYSGWDRSGAVPPGSVGIHHPEGDEKAISFNDDPLTTSNSCIGTGGRNTHWRVDNWEDGTTEPGSSGSGLWHPVTQRLVGFLSGGQASCANPGGHDCYGKFSVAWNGSTAATRLRDWLDPQGTGPLVVNGANPPIIRDNDNFANRETLAGRWGHVRDSNVQATREGGEPNHVGNSGGKSVWWSWRALATGTVVFHTQGSNFDTLLAVYTGTRVNALTLVQDNDDYAPPNRSSRVQFPARAGITYQIAVDGYNGATGSIVLNWGQHPFLCRNQVPTRVGSAGNDNLIGTVRNDVILGLGGNDTIRGGGGNDVICGGTGNDVLSGDAGNDQLSGDSGHDILRGGEGNDRMYGGLGTDTCNGGIGTDTASLCETEVGVP